MKTKILLMATLLTLFWSSTKAAPIGSTFTYQGRLTDNGAPANGHYDLRFKLYDPEPPYRSVTVTNTDMIMSGGVFSTLLETDDLGVFGDACWLEIAVRTNGSASDFTVLKPDQALTAVPYAIYSLYSGNAWKLNGQDSTAYAPAVGSPEYVTKAGDHMTGPLTLPTDGLRVGTNQLFVSGDNVGIAVADPQARLDVNGTVRATAFRGDGPVRLCVSSNQVLVLEWGASQKGPDWSAPNVIAGAGNSVLAGVVGATISGGGGIWNGNPTPNTVAADWSTIGGGAWSMIESDCDYAIIGGGLGNAVCTGSPEATISGGYLNVVFDNCQGETLGGGKRNAAYPGSVYATIGGGTENRIWSNAWSATISGGRDNSAGTNALYATVGGGAHNAAKNVSATVAGGYGNLADGRDSVIGGGFTNRATGLRSTVPGGHLNQAAGDYSFAAGQRAKANHSGTFVWADATDADFISTGPNQVLIRASGGVGIGKINPVSALDVNGTVTANNFSGDGGGLTGLNAATLAAGTLPDERLSSHVALRPGGNTFTGNQIVMGGKVGIGTMNPQAALEVYGVARIGALSGLPEQELDILVDGQRAMRILPTANGWPNLIGGSEANYATPEAAGAVIGGGVGNTVEEFYTSVGGGQANHARGIRATVGGGSGNNATADSAVVGGGMGNSAVEPFATVAGRYGNQARGPGAFVGGGGWDGTNAQHNCAFGRGSVIAGGLGNSVQEFSLAAAIGGGSSNVVQTGAQFATISGGERNHAGANRSVVAGGWANTNRGASAFIGGGFLNLIGDAPYANINGGMSHSIRDGAESSTIGGGSSCLVQANTRCATIGGGSGNFASGNCGTLAGGVNNTVSGAAATVPGGWYNLAGGLCSLAAGYRAMATAAGAFVWADYNAVDFNPYAQPGPQGVDNSFNVRSTGGFYIVTGIDYNGLISSGTYINQSSGGWANLSDRSCKTNLTEVAPQGILERLAGIPMLEWSYLSDPQGHRHLGPTTQDFNAAFGFGAQEGPGGKQFLSSMDVDGVALAAIQGLNQKLDELAGARIRGGTLSTSGGARVFGRGTLDGLALNGHLELRGGIVEVRNGLELNRAISFLGVARTAHTRLGLKSRAARTCVGFPRRFLLDC